MVRMKLTKDEFNADELDVPYEGPQFERYTGEVPKTGTILINRVTKAWWRLNDDNENQLVLLMVAEQNTGKLKEFNGLPSWEYLTWTPKNSRRYQPFLQVFDLTTKDVMNKMDVEVDDDNIGTPVNSIADWEVGSDDALVRNVIKRDFWNDDWRAKIDWDGWLPFDDDAEPEEEQPRRPARGRSAKPAAPARGRRRADADPDEDEVDEDEDVLDDEDVDDYDDDEDDEPEEQPRRPARGASRSARSTARPARPASRTASSDGRRSTSGSGGRRSTSRAATSRTATKPRGKAREVDYEGDEPPF